MVVGTLPLVLLFAAARAQRQEWAAPCASNGSQPPLSTRACIDDLRVRAGSASLWWFGSDFERRCGRDSRQRHSLACLAPGKLRRHLSLGSRLLRLPTFHPAFLADLTVFPRLQFTSPPGNYTACGHAYSQSKARRVDGFVGGSAVDAWDLRYKPQITWERENIDEQLYMTLLMDVSEGTLHYLEYNGPKDPTIIRNYSGPLNHRHGGSPLAVVVFRQTSRVLGLDWEAALEPDSGFSLPAFILANRLQHALVGLNWVTVRADPYAIQRLSDTRLIHNCPSLLRPKIPKVGFLPHSWLREVDTWLNVVFHTPPLHVSVCCEDTKFKSSVEALDPLGSTPIGAALTRLPPRFSVTPPLHSQLYSYRRSGRDYLALLEQGLYTLLVVQADGFAEEEGSWERPLLIWLVANLPAQALREDGRGESGDLLMPYLAPTPRDTPSRLVFLLFGQERRVGDFQPHLYTQPHCPRHLANRCQLSVSSLMARNGLRLRGLSWASVAPDASSLRRRLDFGEEGLCAPKANCHPSVQAQMAGRARGLRASGLVLLFSWLLRR